MKCRCLPIIVAISVFSCFQLQAQKDNYWAWTFNTPSTLLGGAVVGGSAGPSAIYYNPALIGKEKVPKLSISASLLSLSFLNIENIAGEGLDASKFLFTVQPRFFSYVLPLDNERLAIEIAALSPAADNKEYVYQNTELIDLIERTTGLETYNSYLRYRYKYDDWLIGAGLSYTLTDNINIGASAFVEVQTMRYQYEQRAEAFQESDSVEVNNTLEPRYIAQTSYSEDLKYWDISLLLKLGAQYVSNNDRLRFGLNLTFPNLSVYGEGSARKTYTRSNVYDNNQDVFSENVVRTNEVEKARTTIKTPFSASFGLNYTTSNRRNAILFSTEYFSAIDAYSIFKGFGTNPNPELTDIFNRVNTDTYFHSAEAVWNFAIGYKQYMGPNLTLLGGFRTDFSTGEKDDIRFTGGQFKPNEINLDKYHISLGPVIQIKEFKVISGLQYTYGINEGFLNVVNYADPVEYIPQTGLALQGIRENNARAVIHEFALFFGVIVDLEKEGSGDVRQPPFN